MTNEVPVDNADPVYYLEVSQDLGGGSSAETRVPFPPIEPILDAAEAIAAVYLASGATSVKLAKEITTVTRTPLGES